MPEEKKENKAAAKDSFTFSDKIKNSKPAGSKSFANRISSKIGSDGKPKKTLFERTKRDAPFFIAAIVALLLLPFLYKYSGSVDEDPAMVTPGYEDAIMNPDRSGFDSLAGDPEGQISQLSGRDSMDLIVGFGSKKEESEDFFNQPLSSGLDDNDYGSSNKTRKEYNEKNIYNHRKQAAPATKASFKKTNINPIRPAGLNSRNGGKLGVGMWGGGLKQAANRVGPSAPTSSPKPVSLQPLQAAGKPSRSYFGQGAAAEARRSKDAMSKSNAMQALMDAQMKPIEPGKIGGLDSGNFGGPGGGNGNLDRKFAFNGKEPWWWDMMKQRAQMQWEKKFNYKWGWIDFATGLAQKLADGLLSCLITGTDDWSMGKMFGAAAGAGSSDECCGMDKEKFAGAAPGVEFSPKACKGWVTAHPEVKCATKWVDGKKNSTTLGPITQRLDCLSNGIFSARKARKAAEGIVTNENECLSFYQDGNYTASVAGNYTVYSYVVGVKAEDWDDYAAQTSDDERQNYLTVKYFQKGGHLSVDPNNEKQVINLREFVPLFVESAAVKNKKIDTKKSSKADKLSNTVSFKGYFGTGGKAKGTCGHFENVPYDQAVKKCNAMSALCRRECHSQINEEIRGKDKVKVLHAISENGGTSYKALLEMLREGGIMVDVSGSLAAKGGKAGKDWSTGARCAYPLAFVSCHHGAQLKTVSNGGTNEEGHPAAFLTFPNVGKNLYDKVVKRFTVTYKVADRFIPKPADEKATAPAPKSFFAQQVKTAEGYAGSSATGSRYTVNNDKKYNIAARGKGEAAINAAMGLDQDGKVDADKSAVVTWEVRQCWDEETPWRYGRAIEDGACGRVMSYESVGVDGKDLPGIIVSTATCVYGDDGAVSGGVVENECQNRDQSEKCCRELGGDKYTWKNGKCVENTNEDDDGNPDGHDSDDHNPDGNPPVPDARVRTRLAPVIEWVPSNITARTPVPAGTAPSAANFTGSRAIPTQNDTQHCGAEMSRRAIPSAAAKTFANQVVAAYNAKYKDTPMAELSANYPTMGELVDSLYMASHLGITNVPKEAVCMLGQAMALESVDPHAGTFTWGDARNKFYNELGSYLAYVHPDAAFYPAKYYQQTGNCDKRFLVLSEGSCPESVVTPKLKAERPNKRFHHSNYAWNANKNAYLGSLTDTMKQYPLKALAEGVSFSAGSCREGCGPKRNEYNNKFKFLLQGNCPAGDMKVADALKYVTGVCQAGLDYKPYGTPGRSSGNSSDNSGQSQNNTVTGK